MTVVDVELDDLHFHAIHALQRTGYVLMGNVSNWELTLNLVFWNATGFKNTCLPIENQN